MAVGFDDLKGEGEVGLGLRIEGICGLEVEVWVRSE